MFFEWDDAYNTGVDVIDHQHRRIVEYINTLYNAIARKDEASVADVMEQLTEYTIGHFAFEESLMEQCGYDQISTHKIGHDRFTRKIRKYQQDLDAGENIADKLLEELKSWLVEHIQKEDFAYVGVVPRKPEKGMISKAFSRLMHPLS
ncbi:MAG: bacteriohemerythrin [Candidatus Sedimenticola sp. 20ELBAFRAG]